MAEQKMGPKEAAQRALREQRAKEMQEAAPKVKTKSIGKLHTVRMMKKPGGRGK